MVRVKISDGVSGALDAMADEMPRSYARMIYSLGQKFRKKQMEQYAQGNVGGVAFAPLNPITIALRQRELKSLRRERKLLRRSLKSKQDKGGLSMRDVRAARKVLFGYSTRRMRQLNPSKFGGRIPSLARFKTPKDGGEVLMEVGFLGDVVPRSDVAVTQYQTAKSRAWSRVRKMRDGKRGYSEVMLMHTLLGKKGLYQPSYIKPQRLAVSPLEAEYAAEAEDALGKTADALVKYYSKKGIVPK